MKWVSIWIISLKVIQKLNDLSDSNSTFRRILKGGTSMRRDESACTRSRVICLFREKRSHQRDTRRAIRIYDNLAGDDLDLVTTDEIWNSCICVGGSCFTFIRSYDASPRWQNYCLCQVSINFSHQQHQSASKVIESNSDYFLYLSASYCYCHTTFLLFCLLA